MIYFFVRVKCASFIPKKKEGAKRASIPINFQLFPLYLSTNNSYCRLTECFSRRFTTSLGSCWTCHGPNNGGAFWRRRPTKVFCSHIVVLGGVIMYVSQCYTMLFYVLICYIVLCYYLYILPYMKPNSLNFSIKRLLRQTYQTYETYQYPLISTKRI